MTHSVYSIHIIHHIILTTLHVQIVIHRWVSDKNPEIDQDSEMLLTWHRSRSWRSGQKCRSASKHLL